LKSLVPIVAWRLDGSRDAPAVLDGRLLPLIEAIDALGSLTAAARAAAIPYRSAWALLDEAERALGAPLVLLFRGKGAVLAPLARRWLAANASASALLTSSAPRIDVVAAHPPASEPAPRALRIAASHDIALAQLKDRWRVASGIALEFHGSAASIDAYLAGRVEIAGFHVAGAGRAEADPLLARLDRERDAVFRFLVRDQGLVVARGNPRRIRSIRDLAAKRLTMVNRQPGSGTRLLFDRLLAREGVAASTLAGYANEEFTHAAVAATVASGRADVGFAIRAAAAQFGLSFVPIVSEHYLFACARRAVDAERIAAFRALLASRATRAVVSPLPGYALDSPGKLFPRRRQRRLP
jgi:putative molybdopterin biosynthesis protein